MKPHHHLTNFVTRDGVEHKVHVRDDGQFYTKSPDNDYQVLSAWNFSELRRNFYEQYDARLLEEIESEELLIYVYSTYRDTDGDVEDMFCFTMDWKVTFQDAKGNSVSRWRNAEYDRNATDLVPAEIGKGKWMVNEPDYRTGFFIPFTPHRWSRLKALDRAMTAVVINAFRVTDVRSQSPEDWLRLLDSNDFARDIANSVWVNAIRILDEY